MDTDTVWIGKGGGGGVWCGVVIRNSCGFLRESVYLKCF